MPAYVDANSLFSLKGKVALVTGASGTIGSKISEGFAAFGADLVLAGRNKEKLRATAKIVNDLGKKAVTAEADLLDRQEVDALVQKTADSFGRVDILANAHGINIRRPMESMPLDEWENVMDTNLKSVFLLCQSVGKEMIKQKSGKIITVSSVAARLGYDKGYAAYSPSKAGVDALTRVLAAEWGKHHINVNAIAPFFIRSALTENVLKDKEFYDWVLGGVPMKTLGVPEDVVGASVFLASRASDWVSGQTIYIDGARTVT